MVNTIYKAALALGLAVGMSEGALADGSRPYVRIAELEIDPVQLAAYHSAVKEEILISVRDEPGVLSIYSVAEEGAPHRLHFFEIYADKDAYEKHIASPHFQRYATLTQQMIRSKRLLDTQVVELKAKPIEW